MEQLRKEQLSIYYWLKDLFPDFVTIVDEYPTDELILPTIAIVSSKVEATPFELGGDDLDYRAWHINVYGKDSAQRDDYSTRIFDNLGNCIEVYNYDEGFPPNVSPSKIGSLIVVARSYEPLRVYEELVKKKYWWGLVSFRTYFDPLI